MIAFETLIYYSRDVSKVCLSTTQSSCNILGWMDDVLLFNLLKLLPGSRSLSRHVSYEWGCWGEGLKKSHQLRYMKLTHIQLQNSEKHAQWYNEVSEITEGQQSALLHASLRFSDGF